MINKLTPVYTEQTECQDCYKCIRRCPVKAIRVENGHAAVIGELCIACGQCVKNCPVNAKKFRNDVSFVKHLLKTKNKVIVSLAPSFVAEFSQFSIPDFISAIKELGFFGISETALGAEIISSKTAQILATATQNSNSQKLFLSSACPAAVEFIKHYMNNYAEYIINCASPLLAHARYLRNIYGNEIGIVFIGPCIAKKREADVWSEIDAALTYQELMNWFKTENIEPKTILPIEINTINEKTDILDKLFIPRRAAKAELFPLDGGMISACKTYFPLKSVKMISVSGIENIKETLTGLNVKDLREPLFLELLSCSGGCINGPGSTQTQSLAIKRIRTEDFALSANKKLSQNIIDTVQNTSGTLPGKCIKEKIYTDKEICIALHSVGKYNISDEINCGGCGYETCRNFAKAMLDGIAEKTMCVSYMRNLAQKKANGLMKAIPSGVVIVNRKLNIVECNKNFATLMGKDIQDMYAIKPGLEGADFATISENSHLFADVLIPGGPEVLERDIREKNKILHYTIFIIEKGEVAAGVIEDITTPQSNRKRTITQARKVIDKNLSVVQKIAFLLGENAAETEATLNSIIESFGGDDDIEQ